MVVGRLVDGGLPIASAKRIRLTTSTAQRFYETHRGMFFYDRLVRHMTSGDSIAVLLASDTGAARRLVGGGKVWPPRTMRGAANDEASLPLRHAFSISDVRNVAHVSDDDRAEEELRIIEGVQGEEVPLNELR